MKTRPLVAPARDDLPAGERDAYDAALSYWSDLFLPDGGGAAELSAANAWAGSLMHSPRFSLQRAELSGMLRSAPDSGDTFRHQDREWVGVTLGPHLGSLFLTATHIPAALDLGIRPAAIEALLSGRDEDLAPEEIAQVQFIRQVVDGAVTDESFAAMQERLGERGVVEYVYYITCIWTAIRQIQAYGCPDPTTAEAIEILHRATAASGRPAS